MSTFAPFSLNTLAGGTAAQNTFGFGQNPATPAPGQTQPTGFGLGFGQTPATPAPGQTQTTPALSFGQTQATPALSFGQTQATPALSFGQTQATPALSFGQTQPTGFGLGFGQTPATPAPGQTQATPALSFGQTQPTSIFGQTQAAPAFGQTQAAPAFGQTAQPGQPGIGLKEQSAEIMDLSRGSENIEKAVLSFFERINRLREGEKKLTENKQKMGELHQKVEAAQREIDSRLSKLIHEFVKVQDTFAQKLGRVEADFGNKWYSSQETDHERRFGGVIRDLESKLNATDVSDGLISELDYAIDLIPQKKEIPLSEDNIRDIEKFLDEEEEKLFKIEEILEKSVVLKKEIFKQ